MSYYNYKGIVMPETPAEQGNIRGTSAGNETIQAPDGPSSVSGEGGGDTLLGSNGGNRFWITDAHDKVVEPVAGGIDTEIGWVPIILAPNVENAAVYQSYSYAVGNDLDNLIVVGDDQHQWLYGAKGDDVLVGGAGADTFLVRAGEGSDVIYGWNPSDQLKLVGYNFPTPAAVMAAMTQVGPDVVVRLSPAETLTIRGVTPASFTDKQFLLTLDHSKLGAVTFQDNFDTLNTFNPSTATGVWQTNFGGNLKDAWAYTLVSNGEAQVYAAPGFQGSGDHDLGFNPFSISNGMLDIRAQPIAQNETSNAFGAQYASGMLNTLDTFQQKYGYFEMRAELPTAAGTWPAFWMIAHPFNGSGEADIMEALGATPNVDYRRAWGTNENYFDNGFKVDAGGFHTYGLLWTPQTITFYYDDGAVLTAPTPASWTGPMGMIVNLAVGGWGGPANPADYPADLKIDYVRAYALADGSTQVVTPTPAIPAATLQLDTAATGAPTTSPATFQDTGAVTTSAHVMVLSAKPAPGALPHGQNFLIWEDAGAVFGAVCNGIALDTPTALAAGSVGQFTGTGAWLTDSKVVVGFMAPGAHGQSAWDLVFDPATHSFVRQELGAANGGVDFAAESNGDFAVSWHAPDGTIMGRGYDSFTYDGKGFYGPSRTLSGDVSGAAGANQVIVSGTGGAQQVYDAANYVPILAGKLAFTTTTLTQAAGTDGSTFSFTITRSDEFWQKATVAWAVTGSGPNPAEAADFSAGAMPSGVVTFGINDTSKTVTVKVAGDATHEPDEQFMVTLSHPVGADLGAQTTATGVISDAAPAPPPDSPPPPNSQPPPPQPPPTSPPPASGGQVLTGQDGGGNLTGGSGPDTLVGGHGSDTMTGGAGTDVFRFGTIPWNAAHITDFTPGADKLDLTSLLSQAGYGGSDPVADGYVKFLDDGHGGSYLYFDRDGSGTAVAWGDYVADLEHVAPGTVTIGDLVGASSPPPTSPPTSPPPQSSGMVISATRADDTLTGGAGNDTINASRGSDLITGGAGNDHFVFGDVPWSPAHITDFTHGQDVLDLRGVFKNTGYTGNDPVADHYLSFVSDGNGGTKVLFDADGAATGQLWPSYIINLDHVAPTGMSAMDWVIL